MKISCLSKYMHFKVFLSLLFVLSLGISLTRADKIIPLLEGNQIPGLTIKEIRSFSDKELYGYIDGGAEIYREFGFVKLSVQFLQYGENDLVLEIYRMKDIKAAFGIYSVSRHNCPPLESLAKWSCNNPFQISFARGPFCVTITNYEGTPELADLSQQIAGKIIDKISEPDFEIPTLINQPDFASYLNNLKFIAGPLGLQNASPEWLKYFDKIASFSGFVLPIEIEEEWAIFTKISFVNEEDFEKFYHNAGFSSTADQDMWQLKTNENNIFWLRVLDQKNIFITEVSKKFPDLGKFKQLINRRLSESKNIFNGNK
jgi:hypothetical protein